MFNLDGRRKKFYTITHTKMMKNMDSNFIITCPACGYSFKNPEKILKKNSLICPMCRYIFKDHDDMPSKFDDFTI